MTPVRRGTRLPGPSWAGGPLPPRTEGAPAGPPVPRPRRCSPSAGDVLGPGARLQPRVRAGPGGFGLCRAASEWGEVGAGPGVRAGRFWCATVTLRKAPVRPTCRRRSPACEAGPQPGSEPGSEFSAVSLFEGHFAPPFFFLLFPLFKHFCYILLVLSQAGYPGPTVQAPLHTVGGKRCLAVGKESRTPRC